MLNHPTADRLRELNLLGMLTAWQEQQETRDIASLSEAAPIFLDTKLG